MYGGDPDEYTQMPALNFREELDEKLLNALRNGENIIIHMENTGTI